jgi:hypothetical protein
VVGRQHARDALLAGTEPPADLAVAELASQKRQAGIAEGGEGQRQIVRERAVEVEGNGTQAGRHRHVRRPT